MTTKRSKIGFIGVSAKGSWATKSHLPFLKSDRNQNQYTITALQNSSLEAAQKAAKAYNLQVATYGTPEDIANDENVDIVAVSVNVPSHYEALMPALRAGKDVFVEWPLARNLADAEEMTALAKEKGIRTLVGLQARQNPSIVAVKRLVDEGALGEILGTTMHGYGLIFGATNSTDFAYGFPVEAGANLLTIPFGHAIDALCFVLGELEYVSASLANRRPKFPLTEGSSDKIISEGTKTSHDYVAVTGPLQRDGGIVNAVYEGGQNPSGGSSFFWQINGTKGTVVLEGAMGHVQMWQPKVRFGKVGEEMTELDIKWVGADFSYNVGEAWNAFAGYGEGHHTTFEHALIRHKMIDAIYRSNEKGTRESYV